VATARRPETLNDLPGSILRLPLDVDDPVSVEAAIVAATAATGGITAVVNNAGYGQVGPIEAVGVERVEAQFQTNVFGPLRVANAVLPQMRERGHGTIVNISSVMAYMAFAYYGIYCASKSALWALSDAMRVEVGQFGVRVVQIECGTFKTQFIPKCTEQGEALVAEMAVGEFAGYRSGMRKTVDQGSPTEKLAADPALAARVVLDAIESANPKARYRLGNFTVKIAPYMLPFMPDRLMDKLTAKALELQQP
jgi:NAD(P)-dependent dehydrogenase (short-subunit alcohol dehydrogenase family)